jgi:SAM-dependent methyltransferase
VDPDRAGSGPDLASELSQVYTRRFSDTHAQTKAAVWVEITRYLQRFVADGPVLDLGCDRGDFIRNIKTDEKWATDLRDVAKHLPPDVHFVQADGLSLVDAVPAGHFGTIFMSNYLEHLPGSEAVIRQFEVAHELLREGGRVIVLQPNIRLVGVAYWDFIDHKVALTEHSLVEAAETAGFRTERMIVRFLPYTTKSRLPQRASLVRAYLRFPIAWRLLGKQTLYVGTRS